MKTYVLTVSIVFPATHKRKGEPTYFPERIICAVARLALYKIENGKWVEVTNDYKADRYSISPKIHTIRANYDLWAKRIKEVQDGTAILSLRHWSGKPYNSKQVEFCQLDKDSGVGVQMLEFNGLHGVVNCGKDWITPDILAKNDGLSYPDFKDWFLKYDLRKPMAIIHFTPFRYCIN